MIKAEKEAVEMLASGRMRSGEHPAATCSPAAATTETSTSREVTSVGTTSTSAPNEPSESDDESNDSDVSDDVSDDVKIRQTKWSAECATTLPNFDLVRNNTRSVDDWCKSAASILAEYWGPEGLIRQAIIDCVKLPEFQRASFDPCTFTRRTLLEFIASTWKQRYAKTTVELVLAKQASESWIEFLDRLRQWTAKKGMTLPDEWYLDQLKGNTSSAADILRGAKTSAEEWALAMDTE